MIDASQFKSLVGMKFGPFTEDVTQERIRAFTQAIGAHSLEETPPTFMTLCRRGEFECLKKLEVPLNSVLHGEQEYFYDGLIQAGDQLSYETELVQAFEKKGSSANAMMFLVLETRIQTEAVESMRLVARAKTTIIVRGRSS